jgi:hypothetical protein
MSAAKSIYHSSPHFSPLCGTQTPSQSTPAKFTHSATSLLPSPAKKSVDSTQAAATRLLMTPRSNKRPSSQLKTAVLIVSPSTPTKQLRFNQQLSIATAPAAASSSTDFLANFQQCLIRPNSSAFFSETATVAIASNAMTQSSMTPAQSDSSSAAALPDFLKPDLSAFSSGPAAEESVLRDITPVLNQAPSIKKERDLRQNRIKFLEARGNLNTSTPAKIEQITQINKMENLLAQPNFVVSGTTYRMGKELGAGQFASAYATDKPGFVLKLVHKRALFLDLYAKPASYWEGIKRNYDRTQNLRLSNNRSPIAQIKNSGSMATDFFAIQEEVTPLNSLSPEKLEPHLPQIKEIFALFYKEKLVLELHKKNLGISKNTGTVVVYDLDREAELHDESDDDLPTEEGQANSLEHNLNRNLDSFSSSSEVRKYLDPRNKTQAK